MNFASWLVVAAIAILFIMAIRKAAKNIFGSGCGCHGGGNACCHHKDKKHKSCCH